METWRHPLETAPPGGPAVVTLGNFDGVHGGHRHLLRQAVSQARALGLRAAAVTFEPHPSLVVAPQRKPRLLMTLPQKLAAFSAEGMDLAWVIPFSRDFSELSPERFLDGLAAVLRPVALHVGSSFRFGRDRGGNLERLQAWGLETGCAVHGHRIPAPDGGPLSSSRVREALEAGDVALASVLLTIPYTLTGVVEDGDRRGRHLGFPTANLAWEQEQLPAWGVYVTEVRSPHLPEPHLGLTNVGEKPTFQGRKLTVETHLPGFSGDLYGSRLEVAFLHRLRGEQRFPDLEALMAQIAADVEAGRSWWEARR